MTRFYYSLTLLFALGLALGVAASATARDFIIPNHLKLTWEGEHVSFQMAEAELPDGPLAMRIQDRLSPVQVERLGDGQVRLWTVATITGDADKSGRPGKDGPATLSATLLQQAAPSPLQIREDGPYWLIENGVYAFRVHRYADPLPAGTTLADLPHWIGGMKTQKQGDWDGRAWFEGTNTVSAARTEIVAQGPVQIDLRVTYTFDTSTDGETPALPLALGKQTHLWPPNEQPVETVPKRKDHYEVLLRFVVGDAWIDVNERYHFPKDPSAEPWGVSQYWLEWGKQGLPVDTVSWVRWFEYDAFGGNSSQEWVPATPRPAQKGRPFALLRPRWNQGGGGAQDFVITRGGPPPSQAKTKVDGKTVWVDTPVDASYDPENPALGLVAAYASKWVGPYPATIAAYVLDGDHARARFPMTDGERSGRHYGQRAYGLCVGPRRMFNNLNSLVRRHTDWTLTAQINRYVLDWERAAPVADVKLPSAQLFIERRYQDDFLNPTSRATRDVSKILAAKQSVGDKAVGGPWQAALGYIFGDLDHWPGWQNGFTPGNPNFHTDKYMAAVYVAAAMPDHPHAKHWLAYGQANFREDMAKVLVAPDGVGYECPGYSGYSLRHQLDLIRVLRDTASPKILDEMDLVKKSADWHRKLLTPFDIRIRRRHEAPIGDTHRWDSGLGGGFGMLAFLYQVQDPEFAARMLGTQTLLQESGATPKVMDIDKWLDGQTIDVPSMDAAKMDWSSQPFAAFGAILRTGFGTPQETFLSFKAGSTRGHYHNDEMSFHYYADGTPISLDYNCSYHPRGDHAALHNSATFGQQTTVTHNERNEDVQAMEELTSSASVREFHSTPAADVIIAERSGSSLVARPLDPHDSEFSRNYPSRDVGPISHRRSLVLVKHPADSVLTDYLVVRDEFTGTEPAQINVHLLARELSVKDGQVNAVGQWDKDMQLAIFPMAGEPPRIEERAWHYYDDWMLSPGDAYTLRPGESQAAWATRLRSTDTLPTADWAPAWKQKGDADSDAQAAAWHKQIHDTDGQALIPPPGWNAEKGWLYGEYQKWVRIHFTPGQSVVWVLYPYDRDATPPQITWDASSKTISVTSGAEHDRIDLQSPIPSVTH